jgi:hypothetical protein
MEIINKYSYRKIVLIVLFAILLFLSACVKAPVNEDPKVPIDPNNPIDPVEKELVPYPIGLNVETYKVKYTINEVFDGTIGKVEALYSDATLKDVKTLIVIDSSKFDNTKDGTYEIIISFEEDLNDKTYVVKSFYLAIVGTGDSTGGGPGDDEEDDVFGPGTYTFDGSVDLATYDQGGAINVDTKFAGGFFVMKGVASKRANATTYAIELVKAEGSWIEFEVNISATLTIICSSTGSSNTSAIALFNDESTLVANNESITTVTGTDQISITYILTTGTYRILSQANTSYSTRGARVYKVTVIQE